MAGIRARKFEERKHRARETKIEQQRLAYAVKACLMMGKSNEQTSRALCLPESTVRFMRSFIDCGMVDFDSDFKE